jgi:hypothetical protein
MICPPPLHSFLARAVALDALPCRPCCRRNNVVPPSPPPRAQAAEKKAPFLHRSFISDTNARLSIPEGVNESMMRRFHSRWDTRFRLETSGVAYRGQGACQLRRFELHSTNRAFIPSITPCPCPCLAAFLPLCSGRGTLPGRLGRRLLL